MANDLLLTHCKALVQLRPQAEAPVYGREMAELPMLENAWLLIREGLIHSYGSMDQGLPTCDYQYNLAGRMVFPSFVDSHTHLVFAATREAEFVDRINGLSYEEIAKRGGGILNSARHMAQASEEDLFEQAWQRLQEVIATGTGAIEIKSGYGLSTDSELKMLRVIKEIRKRSPIPVKATFLGAHAFPAQFKNDHEGYIKEIITQMIPQIAKEGLADYCDVFCDRGFFSPEETDRILKAALDYGLKPRLHANELGHTGGVQVGVNHKAVSIDHLEYLSSEEIELLKNSLCIPTGLPGTAFFLGIPYPDARAMMEANLPLALASDYNPGSCPSGNMPFVLSLACLRMKMTPEEAINATTLNTACALELQQKYGSISPGKVANLWISKPLSSIARIPYSFGSNLVDQVILNGEVYKA
jgi:imidazolonepropionase